MRNPSLVLVSHCIGTEIKWSWFCWRTFQKLYLEWFVFWFEFYWNLFPNYQISNNAALRQTMIRFPNSESILAYIANAPLGLDLRKVRQNLGTLSNAYHCAQHQENLHPKAHTESLSWAYEIHAYTYRDEHFDRFATTTVYLCRPVGGDKCNRISVVDSMSLLQTYCWYSY